VIDVLGVPQDDSVSALTFSYASSPRACACLPCAAASTRVLVSQAGSVVSTPWFLGAAKAEEKVVG